MAIIRAPSGVQAEWRRPVGPFEACDMRPGRVSSMALVRYRNVYYSGPTAHADTTVVVKGFVESVVLVVEGAAIARHRRSYEAGDMVLRRAPLPGSLERKPGALDLAAPLQGWELPPAFAEMRRLLEARAGRAGKREYIQILRLTEIAPPAVVGAVIKQSAGHRQRAGGAE